MSNFEDILDKCKVYGMLDSDDDFVYSVKRLKQELDCEELLQENLYVFKKSDNYGWMNFAFANFIHLDDNDVYVEIFWKGCGQSELGECRHSWLGEDGYVFYINRSHFDKCFDWLEQYYELD
jgi:hypothetical protein